MTQDPNSRIDRAREQLAALLAYGNDDERAEQARAEISSAEIDLAALDLAESPSTALPSTRRGGSS